MLVENKRTNRLSPETLTESGYKIEIADQIPSYASPDLRMMTDSDPGHGVSERWNLDRVAPTTLTDEGYEVGVTRELPGNPTPDLRLVADPDPAVRRLLNEVGLDAVLVPDPYGFARQFVIPSQAPALGVEGMFELEKLIVKDK